mgnify:FL=1
MNKIIIITSCSLRHLYFAQGLVKSLNNINFKIILEGETPKKNSYKETSFSKNIIENHFNARHNSEIDFFSESCDILNDKNILFNIKKGLLNENKTLDYILDFNPNLIVTYGCSIIKPKLINLFKNRIINIHLGLSPYYKGAGTNFHALVNNEPDIKYFTLHFIIMDWL